MIDGVDSLNNILVIGMTNRKDMIGIKNLLNFGQKKSLKYFFLDEAILRPGRFEVHIEVNLPDEKGR